MDDEERAFLESLAARMKRVDDKLTSLGALTKYKDIQAEQEAERAALLEELERQR